MVSIVQTINNDEGQKMMIDGLDENGEVLSLAPRANDAGWLVL